LIINEIEKAKSGVVIIVNKKGTRFFPDGEEGKGEYYE
jgi:photosystem II stability/assembly factor-like uncharacterized protein